MNKITITPEYSKDSDVYHYVGVEKPHYLKNVREIKNGVVYTWCVNAMGQYIYENYPVEEFNRKFQRRSL